MSRLCWIVTTDTGEVVRARFCIMATGPLSAALTPGIQGPDTFAGEVYHTAYRLHEGVGTSPVKRVAVIGMGSSGVQSILVIAEQAEQFLRLPARRTTVCLLETGWTDEEIADIKANYAERRRLSWRKSGGGSPHIMHPKLTLEAPRRMSAAAFENRAGNWAGCCSPRPSPTR